MKTLNIRKMGGAAKQAGFTIIELVVVILLLGILTATALPRFVDVTDEAHAAAVDGVLGGFGTGVSLFKAQWEGESRPIDGIEEFGSLFARTGTTIPGYPGRETDATAHTSGAHCAETFSGILQLAGAPVVAGVAAAGADALAGVGVTAAATAGVDWVAVWAATPVGCEYYYVGNGAVAGQENLPVITYLPATGSVTLSNTADLPS